MNQPTLTLSLPDRSIAYQHSSAFLHKRDLPTVIFLGGFASDMEGTKATFLAARAEAEGVPFLRFDYGGHGRSSGRFEEATIGSRTADAQALLDRLVKGPALLVGSSLGGWVGLLLARQQPQRVAGFLGIAAAPDFTEDLIRPVLTPTQVEELDREGRIYEDAARQSPPITKKLMDEAIAQLVLRAPLRLTSPVHLVQGKKDRDVPWRHALKIAEHVEAPTVDLTLLDDADHRLSRPGDLSLIWGLVGRMLKTKTST
jgi:pimeloyl-ACP methyl ester carboxylesterase